MNTTKEVNLHIERWTKINQSARVMQVSGIFDIPPSDRTGETWNVSFTLPDKWNIGLIVGPSGSGKTTVARELWGDSMSGDYQWSSDRSIIDDFPSNMSVKDVITLLSSVGFSSPPSWLRPYNVLSNGEQFRVRIARELSEMGDLTVIDEFTSVVDRTVAQIGSAAVSKTVRRMNKKLVAVSCHYDIIEWLEPDWIYNTASGEFKICQDSSGRYLRRRPEIRLTVKRVHHSAWKLFHRFHYLDHSLNKSAKCFVAYINDNPVAFCAILSFPHAVSPSWRISRLVTLPDYQGVSIGSRFGEFLGSAFVNTGKPFNITMSHPALINAYNRSRNWKMYRSPQRSPKVGKTSSVGEFQRTLADKRLTAGFTYVGPAMKREDADRLIGGIIPHLPKRTKSKKKRKKGA